MTIPARYENGVFRPLEAVPVPDGTLVDILVPDASPASDPVAALDALAALGRNLPNLPSSAFTREAIYSDLG